VPRELQQKVIAETEARLGRNLSPEERRLILVSLELERELSQQSKAKKRSKRRAA